VISNGGDEYARVSQLATPEQEILNLADAHWFSTGATDDRPAPATPVQRTAA
jgi:hypothetical protein